MKAKLMLEDLQSDHLSWLSIQPMLLAVRGKDLSAKLEMYNRLNEGQKGLYLFYSYHNHAKTEAEFYWFSAYHINELQTWGDIKRGLVYFGDVKLAASNESRARNSNKLLFIYPDANGYWD